MLKKFLNQKNIKKYAHLVKQINQVHDTLDITHKSLAEQLKEIKESSWSHKQKIIHAMAIAKKSAAIVMNMPHYDVQLMGALALVDGNMAEMKTGEGKTLTCSAAVAANFVLGYQTHVATANEYLARRDAEQLAKLYGYMGLVCFFNIAGMAPEQKQLAYQANVLYSTAQELGFDFLRDNLQYQLDKRVQPLHFEKTKCIIDEADFVLIDEARTPLIISGESPAQEANTYLVIRDMAKSFKRIVGELDVSRFEQRDENGDFWLDEKQKNVVLSEQGYAKLETMSHELGLLKERTHKTQNNISALYDEQNSWLLNETLNALKAQYLYIRDKDYIVRDGEIIIIDQNTGRLSLGRTWSNGLHQAIEAKEGLKVNPENMTIGSISIQNYFRTYCQISGMSGTIMQSSEEFEQIYSCKTIAIPTNKPVVRQELVDCIYLTSEVKYKTMIEDIRARHGKGQPILIGTVSVAESELISELLDKAGIEHNVLNAKNNALEAQIVAQAGKPFAVTVATSMAGRGTDIILGGNKENILDILDEQLASINERMRLASLLTQQLQIQEEIKIHFEEVKENIETFKTQIEINSLLDDEKLAWRIEHETIAIWNELFNLKHRVEKQKELLNEQWSTWRAMVMKVGGLCVMGSSRNESRRIDDQLKGRAGRQGDPGQSIFYMSIEDPWVQIFGKSPLFAQLAKGLQPEQNISSPTIAKIFAKAQRSIEGHHFDMRKNVFQYDSIADEGRKKFLELRNHLLVDNETTKAILRAKLLNDMEILTNSEFLTFVETHKNLSQCPRVEDMLMYSFSELYDLIEEYSETQEFAFYNPKKNHAHETIEHKIDAEINAFPEYIWHELRFNMIKQIDDDWMHHLAFIDEAQKNVGLTSFAQKNPVYEYKKICFGSFANMIDNVNNKVINDFLEAQEQKLEIIENTAPYQDDLASADELKDTGLNQSVNRLETQNI